jgi:hypothetical protein
MPDIRRELRGYCKGVAERNICFFVFHYIRIDRSVQYYQGVYTKLVRITKVVSLEDMDTYGDYYILKDCFNDYYKDKYGFVTITHETD